MTQARIEGRAVRVMEECQLCRCDLLSMPEGVKVTAVRRCLHSYYTRRRQCCLFGTHNRPEKDSPSDAVQKFISPSFNRGLI